MRAHDAEQIEITDVGPIQQLSIPIQPGVVCLKGVNDSGKSEALKAVSRLAGGTDAISCRDKAAAGSVEGLGVKISVRQSARRTGELEALSIEGKLNIADLVSPPIKDPVAADRHRIKALLQLTGVAADCNLFAKLFGFEEHVSVDAMKAPDLVEMAAKIKRDLEAASRKEADAAEKADSKAFACKQATEGVCLQVTTDAEVLQAQLEDAIFEHGQIIARAKSGKEAKERGEQASKNLETMLLRDRLTPGEFQSQLARAQQELDDANKAVAEAERALAAAKNKVAARTVGVEFAANALEAGKREEELIAGWRESIEQANAAEIPSNEMIADAGQAVMKSREALEQAAVVRAAMAKAGEARKLYDEAKEHRKAADSLRESARATDDVLSAAVASESLTVKQGRLVTQHPERGEVFFSERSDGTRWKLAIDEAIKRIRMLGAEKTAIIPVPQVAFSELDPANRRLIHEYAIRLGVCILTAEATDGELRAEAFGGAA
jgi:tetratricopeptide (TPR) repeat protein